MRRALEHIKGFVSVEFHHNKTWVRDKFGRRACSSEVVVDGGDDYEILKILANYRPMGWALEGKISSSVDIGGCLYCSAFSRPDNSFLTWNNTK